MKKNRMRVVGGGRHDEDIRESEYNKSKYVPKVKEKVYKHSPDQVAKYSAKKRDEPYIEDLTLFNAIHLARALKFDRTIELAMYQAAKYYKIPIIAVAQAMGELPIPKKRRSKE